MPKSGFTGISYPFRISNQGGVVLSTTSATDPKHIIDSIQQILGTNYLERVMEPEIYSELDTFLFEPNDETLQNVIKTKIVETLEELEERIETSEDEITFSVETTSEGSFLYADIHFNIIKYDTWYQSKFKVGEISE